MFPESWHTAITICTIAGTVIFFALGKARSDFVAMCALIILMLSGVLTLEEALSGFSNSIIITIAGMFVVGGAILRSGLAAVISGRMLKAAGSNQNLLYMLLMLLTALTGSMVSNTGTVAIMMPIVVSMANSLNLSPSRFLMPLAFMSSMGGMLTLIGNPPNMVVNDVYMKAGFPSLTLFSFFPIGVICMVFGMLVLAPATYYFLSRRKDRGGAARAKKFTLRELADKYQLAQHLSRLSVPEESPMVGQSLVGLGLTSRFGVVIHEIRRKKNGQFPFASKQMDQISPGPHTVIKAGDLLYAVGNAESIEAMAAELGLLPAANAAGSDDLYLFESIGICELVIMSSSQLAGLTVAQSGLREQFGVTLLGIQRGSQYILENFTRQTLQAGDALLVQGSWENITRLDEASQHWVVVGRPQDYEQSGKKGARIFVASVIAGMIATMALGLLPTATTVLLAVVVLILGRCFRNLEDAYSCINWETIIMIACMLPLAIAMKNTGLLDVFSRYVTAVGTHYGPHAALGLIYALTSILNILISFTPLTLLVAPVALQVAITLGASPLPFMFAVATSASMCFASSFSTPSNALVVSAGRYTFAEYMKIGLPLQILLGLVMVFALPMLFPF